MTVESIVNVSAKIGEGPIWDVRQNCLWWIDILGQQLYRFDPQTKINSSWNLDVTPGTVVVRKSGGLMVSVPNGFAAWDPVTNVVKLVAEVEAEIDGNRFNDGKCDPAGRFWAGTMPLDEEEPTGALYSLDAQGQVRRRLRHVTISNGIVWTSDATQMYYIDSNQPHIFAFDYDKATGDISNRRVVFDVPPELGAADGMAIDVNDQLWVAFWGGSCVGQICPTQQRLLRKIELPVSNVTACAFGGPSLEQLFITTATKGLSPQQRRDQPLAGNLFVAAPGVRGVPAAMYAG